MITAEDREIVCTLINSEGIPEEVAEEIAIRTRWLHGAGGTGALGVREIISILRSFGYAPPQRSGYDPHFGPEAIPGQTRIVARFGGNWLPGLFMGRDDDNRPLVKLDGDVTVTQCHDSMLRLEEAAAKEVAAEVQEIVEQNPIQEASPDSPEVYADPVNIYDWSKARTGDRVAYHIDGDQFEGAFVEITPGLRGVITILPDDGDVTIKVPVGRAMYLEAV